MKRLELSFVTAVAALAVFGTAPLASATLIPDTTYVFQSTDGDTYMDGSEVTFTDAGDLISWNLVDSAPLASSDGYSGPLTNLNSSVAEAGYFDSSDWYFVIGNSSFYFEGLDGLGGPGAIYDKSGDPTGNWNVPDGGATVTLLGIALVGLVAAGGMAGSRRPRNAAALMTL